SSKTVKSVDCDDYRILVAVEVFLYIQNEFATIAMSGNQEVRIHDVWNSNVEEEFGKLRSLIEDYPFVAMDTEFPGVVATPLGTFKSKEDFNYQQVSCNVNMLKLIQVGFALVDEKGDLPPTGDVWQFNFHFSLNDDMYSQESVEMLRAAGIDFTRLQNEGISMDIFGELLTTSGLIVDERITWLTFSSGYDFGYLLKSITLNELPKEESQFFQFHRALFPRCYDIKLMLRMPGSFNTKLKGGLQEARSSVADQLDVKRHGMRHQAGSDALLTAKTFFKIKQQFFNDNWEKHVSQIISYLGENAKYSI
ncbi:CAF1 family ribonuclease, partial [Dictyocaulus viviparus]